MGKASAVRNRSGLRRNASAYCLLQIRGKYGRPQPQPGAFLDFFPASLRCVPDDGNNKHSGEHRAFSSYGDSFSYGLSDGKKGWLSIPACLLVSAVFELLQWTTGTGATDIDDIILNTAGGALGAAIYFWILRRADAGRPYPWALIGALLIFGIVGGIFFYAYAPAVLFP